MQDFYLANCDLAMKEIILYATIIYYCDRRHFGGIGWVVLDTYGQGYRLQKNNTVILSSIDLGFNSPASRTVYNSHKKASPTFAGLALITSCL